ncbi:MAG: ECF transporter S component [Eubacteriales bacterium]|nr:ECF transporter S component [Clostridium sp.]MDY5798545.1 ECF transporter S component [Eubacteriales bacterium]
MNNKTLKLTVYALFLAIMLVMGLVPGLGFIPTPVAGIAIIQVPVILASYFLGYKGGMFFGLVFGITSIINCFIQPDVFAAIIMNAGGIKTIGLMIICLVIPRVLIGLTTRATYDLIYRFDKTRLLSMGLSAFIGTLTNTVFFLGAFYMFAREACMTGFGAANEKALFDMMLGVVTFNGVIEAVTSVVLCTAIGQALYRFFFKKHPMDVSIKNA